MSEIKQLLIIGCGNMAGAMLAGWLAAGIAPERFAVLNRTPKPMPVGVKVHANLEAAEQTAQHDAVMLGFKPHQLGEVARDFQELAKARPVYSLLAGITLSQLQSAFPAASAHIRVMPNLASRIGKSPIILSETGLDEGARDATHDFFDHLGNSVWLDSEEHYDLATALAGSGPGFVYRFIDALAVAATRLGLEAEQANALALAMVDGAASLAANADISPGELADRVASPGGMTREGLNVLDREEALTDLLTQTLKATADRGSELSKASS